MYYKNDGIYWHFTFFTMKNLIKLFFFLLPSIVLAQTTSLQYKAKQEANINKITEKMMADKLSPPSQVTIDFYKAFTNSNLPLADALLQQGADINCRNCGELTPLMWAISQGIPTSVRWILDRGADANQPGKTMNGVVSPLVFSTNGTYGLFDIIKTLLKYKADPDSRDFYGNTPIMLLARRNLANANNILGDIIYHGANINNVNNDGKTALIIAIESSSSCGMQTIQFLLANGADPSIKTNDGKIAENYAYQQALKGGTTCNQVMMLLRSPVQAIGGDLSTSKEKKNQSIGSGTWQGVFYAIKPRNSSVAVTASISPTGESSFSSASGLKGVGTINLVENQIEGGFTAKSPEDVNGNPVYRNTNGSSDIVFKIRGVLSNGVIRGSYTSDIESGSFAMCNDTAFHTTNECKPPQTSASDLLKVFGGLLGVLKANGK